jgi:hypothetical protein
MGRDGLVEYLPGLSLGPEGEGLILGSKTGDRGHGEDGRDERRGAAHLL